MPFNLITTPWLPVRLRDGSRKIIRPAQMVENIGTEQEAVFPDWPRPDLNVATLELLVGLLQTTFAPHHTKHWLRLHDQPPTAADLDQAFAPLAEAFNLDGSGPRFMQDFDQLEDEPASLDGLFIDASGENAIRKNADLMVKRARYPVLSRPAAAIALHALQQFAPSGGRGNRTSMRGGGPMTTLAFTLEADESAPSLWRLLWPNVLLADHEPPANDMQHIFPWLAPTITSENGEELHETDPRVHPLQAFFGMPRRIRLIFEENRDKRPCALTGIVDDIIATACITRPYGMNYGKWRHPLTPYYRPGRNATELLPMHPGTDRFNYGNWLAVAIGGAEGASEPAKALTTFRNDRQNRLRRKPRLLVAGWAMSNMRPLDYLYAEQPLHMAQDGEHQQQLDDMARRMVLGAEKVSGALIASVQAALETGGKKPKSDSSLINAVRESFFADTESRFHDLLSRAAGLREITEEHLRPLREEWLHTLQRAAWNTFDEAAPLDPLNQQEAARIIEARRKLTRNLFGKQLATTLDLPNTSRKGKAA